MYLIIGLGNPGSKYEPTRHNVGFVTLDFLSNRHNIKITKLKHKALIGEGEISGEKVVLMKPQTFMNLSGESVLDIVNWHKIEPDKIIVIYDDVDIAVGKVRIRPSGSAGSHNGMKSIIHLLKNQNFTRIRIGIGKQPDYMDLGDYVLSRFAADEIEPMEAAVRTAVFAIEDILKVGLNNAMNKHNKQNDKNA